ncbi:MAG: ABC transporter permease [Planctomycetes bacterium]|nr:ABC transporter permease [Planctomycetota bacterium]
MIRWILNIPRRAWLALAGFFVRSFQNILTALVQIGANTGRSILTTLGIIIAVTSTIIVISVVQGFGNYMTEMVRGYGTQYMVVRPITPRGSHGEASKRVRLDMADVRAIRQECPNVGRMTPFVFTHNGTITYGLEEAKEVPVRGVTEQYQTIRNFFVDKGRFFGPVDVEHAANVIVLGRSLLKMLESDDSIVGEYVYLDGMRFLVVGLLASKGSIMGDDQDKTVMIPYTTAINQYPERRERFPVLVEATSEDDIPLASAQISRVLRRRHKIRPGEPDDFRIERQDQALREFEQIRNVASAILGGIVSISLLVGGIGIMNIMLVSVTERTREIGLRKSLGGRRRDILLQFLTEAVVLCTVGGMVGVVLGYVVTYMASLYPDMIDVSVPLWAVVLALGFSAGTGVVFGIIPAFKAALLHPIDALRHE